MVYRTFEEKQVKYTGEVDADAFMKFFDSVRFPTNFLLTPEFKEEVFTHKRSIVVLFRNFKDEQ